MQRSCDVCGVPYEAKRASSRYCSTRCRTRASRGQVVPLAQRPTPTPVPAAAAGAVERSTAATLENVGRLDTPLGQACIVLARRLDSPGADTGSAMAAVAGRLETMLASATKGAGAATAPQQLRDQLAERRRKHGA